MNYILNIKRIWVVLFVIGNILAGGCATPVPPVHKFLDPSRANKSYNARVVSGIMKEELSILVNLDQSATSGGGIGGLIVVLIQKGINKSRSEEAEQRIAPLLEATADVNFRTQYWNELEKALSSSPWLKTEHLDRRSVAFTEKESEEMKPPFLVLNTFYQLSANARVLIIQTNARLYLKDSKEPDYYSACVYFSNPIGKNEEIDENAIALWTANKASAYREALAEGINQNMDMLRLDLLDKQDNPVSEKGEVTRLRIRNPYSGIMDIYEGKLQSRNEKRVVIREQGGNLFSIGTGLIE